MKRVVVWSLCTLCTGAFLLMTVKATYCAVPNCLSPSRVPGSGDCDCKHVAGSSGPASKCSSSPREFACMGPQIPSIGKVHCQSTAPSCGGTEIRYPTLNDCINGTNAMIGSSAGPCLRTYNSAQLITGFPGNCP